MTTQASSRLFPTAWSRLGVSRSRSRRSFFANHEEQCELPYLIPSLQSIQAYHRPLTEAPGRLVHTTCRCGSASIHDAQRIGALSWVECQCISRQETIHRVPQQADFNGDKRTTNYFWSTLCISRNLRVSSRSNVNS